MEAVFGSCVLGFVCIFYAVEIEVIDRFSGDGDSVFVDDGKRRAVYHVFYSQFLAYCFDEGCFSCAHTAFKGENFPAAVVYESYKFGGGRAYAVDVFYDDCFHILLRLQGYDGNQHLFERNTSVLERIFVIGHVVVVIVGIDEKRLVEGEYVFGT